MDALQEIAQTLLPLALLVGVGYALLRLRFYDPAFLKGLDRLVYWVALPALIVSLLAGASAITGTGRMVAALTLATLATSAAALGAARLLRRPRAEVGVLVQAAFRGNLAFVGLPVIALSGADEALLARAALVFAPIVVLYNVLGVLGLVAAQHRFDAAMPVKLVKPLVTNPLLLACGLGLVLWQLEIALPGPAQTTLGLLGQTAGPLALVSLGGALARFGVGGHAAPAAMGTFLKCVACPAAAWAAAWALGLEANDTRVVLIFAACPTAVASYVLATQLKGDSALASACIAVSTLASGAALAAVLALT